MDTDINWLLLFIGYAIGLIPIAYFGITGTNEAIDYQNKLHKSFERKAEIELFKLKQLEEAFNKAKKNEQL